MLVELETDDILRTCGELFLLVFLGQYSGLFLVHVPLSFVCSGRKHMIGGVSWARDDFRDVSSPSPISGPNCWLN